ncbi:MAG: leucine-rich repeat protein [Ruminococcus sp.]
MKFKRLCCVALAVSMLTTSSAMFTANAEEATSYKSGDVNLDGKITVEDIVSLYDYTVGSYTSSLTAEQFLSVADINGDGAVDEKDVDEFVDSYISADNSFGDVNRDGTLSVSDATYIQNYLVGNVQDFDLCQSLIGDYNKDGSVSVLDVTAVQKQIAGSGTSSYVTDKIKADDAKYRKEYAEYITPNIEAITKNCYLVESDDPDYVIYFRDSKWLYKYIGNPGTIHRERRGLKVIGTYVSDKNIILPSKTDGGVTVDGVGCASGTVLENAGAKMFCIAGDLSLAGYYGSYGPGIELNSVIIPNNYIVEGDAFGQNMTLKHVFMASNVTLYNSCFSECPSLVSVKLSNTLEKIPDTAFDRCSSLAKITIPDSVTSIDHGAFINCAFKEIILGKNVTSIERNAFLNCPLEKVYVYNPVADIGAGAFINRSYGYNSNINPNCKFYGYKNSTLKEWLKNIQEFATAWGNTVTYNFITL